MNNKYSYTGNELELFSSAKNWKRYFSAIIIPYIKGRVLEVGAGTGNTTSYLNRPATISSWTMLEPDGAFCKLLQDQINIHAFGERCTVKQGTIFAFQETAIFDTIIYIDVLEHIEHDKKEIIRASRLLADNGHLIILSPAHPFLYSRFDKAIGHYRRYNKRTLSAAVASSGLKKIRIIYLDSAGYLLSLGNKLLAKQSYPTKKQIKIWDRLFVNISALTDKLLLYGFGKTIVGVWKKI